MPDVGGQESQSTYQYSCNNPVLLSDPDGDCPTCPPYTNPMQPVWEGFGQMFQAGATLIDRVSIATTSLVERTFTLGGTSTTTSNLTSTDTHTNLSSSFSYIKNNNSNEGNPNSFFTTTVKNETSASTKKEVDLGVGKASIKNSVTTDGKVTIETKASVQASKAWSVGATTSVNTNGDSKYKVEGTTGVSKGKAGVFTQFTNSMKSYAAEIGISFETESRNKNVKTKNTASIKYTQNKP
jgi:hypothetical protein